MAQDLKISARVSFIGHCDRVPAFLRCLDIFVLASKFEPFGVAILEAKAAGVAIVATRVNEIPEIISDGTSGLLSPPEDPEAMSRLFCRLSRDTALRAKLGEQANSEARARNSLESVMRGYQELYQASLNN